MIKAKLNLDVPTMSKELSDRIHERLLGESDLSPLNTEDFNNIESVAYSVIETYFKGLNGVELDL